MSEIKQVEIMIDFEQAYRIYKRDNPESEKWYKEAVKIYCLKRVPEKKATLENWIKILKSY